MGFLRLRNIAEHHGLPLEHELNSTRDVKGTLLEWLTISPLNSNYHLTHHLFPSVPHYNLPALHDYLLANNAAYRKKAAIQDTYLGLSEGVLGKIFKPARAGSD